MRNNGILGAVVKKDAGGRRETGNQFGYPTDLGKERLLP